MIFVTGDMHGDAKIFKQPVFKNIKKDDTLIICGDFGFIWNGDKSERITLDKLSKKPYTICFVDGTHENFDLLSKYPVVEFAGGMAHKIRENIYHLLRGYVFEIEGEKIFAMGGGESPDIDIRFENNTWSKAEIPSAEEMKNGVLNLEKEKFEVDFIITHEPPQKIKAFLNLKDKENVRFTGLNSYFEEINSSCKFTRWYFGSIHEDKFVSPSHIAVYRNLIKIQSGEIAR